MTNHLAFFIAAACLLAGPVTAADMAQPICGSREVLAVVAERLQRAGQEMIIDRAAAEVPGLQRGTVRCAVRVQTLFHDTSRFGIAPADEVRLYRYVLTLRKNGIFVGDGP